ncbi:MAG: DUF2784 domain-containing protein [Bacteroidota bacterium]|nr:DUF2784 domain-containing protein [Flavisolibacter sp.]MDQ3846313.1 DUF2784 domain-containing protein [Bacteroidota bacterium]
MLHILDFLLTVVHLAIITFNLFGWILPATRRAHLISILLTAISWFVLGIWFGTGYCPVTDWQWQVKEKLGEVHLPASFIKYFADKWTGRDFDPDVINIITATCFAIAALLSVWVNFILPYLKKRVNS